MPYSISTQDGITIQDIPDDVPADAPQLKERVAKIRSQKNPGPTPEQKLLSSAPMRFARGMKDPLDGAAQLLRKAADEPSAMNPFGAVIKAVTGKTTGDWIDAAANAVGGEGTFAGDVLGIKGQNPERMRQSMADAEQEYQAARKATAPATLSTLVTGERDPGFDWMRLGGNIASPVNVLALRAAPKIVPTQGKAALAKAGAVGGAAGAGLQPSTGDSFAVDKGIQVATGAAAGAALTPAVAKLGEAAARAFDLYRKRGTINVTPEAMRQQIAAQLRADGIEPETLPEAVFTRLSVDAQRALASGRQIDPAAALRQADFDSLGIPALRGQVTRDPMQWQREFNLAGVEGVGEPLQNAMRAQTQGVQGRFQQGARGALERVDAGRLIGDQLRAANRTAEGNVRAAYDAFRQATGRDLEVPLQGLAQDYAATLETFGDAIPSAVRRQFEALGLMSGKQMRGLSIEQAENLIKAINANTDPANRVSSNALGQLRQAVQNSITNAADTATTGAGAEAAALAAEARGMAAQRFRTIDQTPGLRAAINDAAPDDFVQKFVINGKVDEIGRMLELLGPEGSDQVRAQTMAYLQQKAFGSNAAGDAGAAQARFNDELRRIGRPKLVALLGPDGAEEMYRIGRVLAYIKQAPEGATPNRSGTSQAALNALSKLRGVRGLPFVNDYLVQPLARYGDRREVAQALSGAPQQPAQLDPKLVEALSALFSPAPVAVGVAAGQGVR